MDRLHSPMVDRTVCGALLGLLGAVALWNAFVYPPMGGFDAREHIDYAHGVLDGRLPTGGAYYTPPGFYVAAALAIRLGEELGMTEPERAALFLNVLCVVGSGLLVLALARLLLPGRPLARWSALAFFICCPVVLKTSAMFHPQPLAMLLALLAFWITARMIVRCDYRLWSWFGLALTLAGAQLVRSVSIWVVGVVVITLVTAAVAQPEHRRRIGTALTVSALAIVLLPLPWYVHLQSTGGNAILGRGMSVLSFDSPWPTAFYVDPGLPDVITHPQRAELGVGLIPLLYAETWGDYFGIWSWNPPRPDLTASVDRRLALQSVVGLPLTAFALAGWFAFAAFSVARWREAPARIVIALAPLAGFAATLYYITRGYRPDGDTVKALFLLPAVPFWALSFGFAVDVAGRAQPHASVSSPSPSSPFASLFLCRTRRSRSSLEGVGLSSRRVHGRRLAGRRCARRVGDPDRALRGSRLPGVDALSGGGERRDDRVDTRSDRPQRRPWFARHCDRDQSSHHLCLEFSQASRASRLELQGRWRRTRYTCRVARAHGVPLGGATLADTASGALRLHVLSAKYPTRP